MRISKHWDGPDPGATPGRVFTASIGQELIVPGGKFLSHLMLGVRGTIATTAIPIEEFIDLISEYDVWVGPELRIKLDGNDLCALSAYHAGVVPLVLENTDATGSLIVGGIKLPIGSPADPAKPFSHAATRAAQTNVTVETLSVTGYYLDNAGNRKPVHAVVITLTSAGSAGTDTFNFRLPPVGRLVRLIMAMPAASDFTDTNIDVAFERVKLIRDGETIAELNTLGDHKQVLVTNLLTQLPTDDLLSRYKHFDFSDEGFDLKNGVWTLTIDNQDATDALRIIPVIEMQ
ncbi:MAG: hypothetical protein AAB964_01175 [Patescibacteria group bacterium]